MSLRAQAKPIFVLCSRKTEDNSSNQLDATHSEVTALVSLCGHQGALLSGHQCGRLTLWNLNTRQIAKSWIGHPKGILWVGAFGPNGIISFGRDQIVKVWGTQGSEIKEKNTFHTDYIGFSNCEVLEADDKVLVAIPESKATIKILNSETVQTVLKDEKLTQSDIVMAIRFFRDHTRDILVLFAAFESGIMIAWDVTTNSQIARTQIEKDEPITCFDYEPVSKKGVSCSTGSTIRIWRLEDGGFSEITTREITNPGVACVRIRDDAKIFALGGWDNKIRVFSWRTLKPLAVLDFHNGTVNTLIFYPVNTSTPYVYHLVAGSKDGYISFWDLYN